ncbi:hypothetical protein V9T40_007757 [Parthenolecanium corni]|uniref:Uncharacterized protein n=1 Tax=Parthenolecanium corni TaxID=536013 RepID=A0AAN9Y594_9HEMI
MGVFEVAEPEFEVLGRWVDSSCLNSHSAVSIFVQLSQFSSSCLNYRLVVSVFAGCLIFRPVVSIFKYFRI